eukprot:5861368-Amphidinium_carterae.1
MKTTLPAFHTVWVTLPDSVESVANRCTSFVQLQASSRQWSRSIRIAMSRYALNPEPRRMRLSLMSRIGNLQAEPWFTAVLDRHMVQTGVRTIQSLESVLTFTFSIEAEVDAIVQDQVSIGSTGSSRHQARGNSASASDSSWGNNKNNNKNGSGGSSEANAAGVPLSNKGAGKSSGSDKLDLCKLWGTQEGCRFGRTCKYRHPNAKVSDGLCFICGAKSHRSKECKLRMATGDKPTGSSGNPQRGPPAGGKDGRPGGGKPGNGRSSSGGDHKKGGSSRPRTPSQPRGEHARGSSAEARGGKSTRQRSNSRDKGRNGDGSQASGKTDDKKVSNPARALSASVDATMGAEGLLDSGASHVIAPLEALGEGDRQGTQRVSLTLASGKPTESVIKEGEVFAHRVRRVLIPLGKLIRQTGILAVWARSGLHMLAEDETGILRLVYKPLLRQG